MSDENYWRARAVRAEETLITAQSIADANGYKQIEEMVSAYFKDVASGRIYKNCVFTASPAIELRGKVKL